MTHTLQWTSGSDGTLPEHAVCGGTNFDGEPLYVARINLPSGPTPGKLAPSFRIAHASYGGEEHHSSNYEVLTNPKRTALEWVRFEVGSTPPPGAVLGGRDRGCGDLHVGRIRRPDGMFVPGKVCYKYQTCYDSYGGKEEECTTDCDVLTLSDTTT